MAGGRPTGYSDELGKLICERIATSTLGLKDLCRMYDDMPHRDTIYQWRYKHPQFADMYARAKLHQAELLAEEIIEISDDSSEDYTTDEFGNPAPNKELIARSRLRVDTRKWLAAKLIPRTYGERLQTTNETKITVEIEDIEKAKAAYKKEF